MLFSGIAIVVFSTNNSLILLYIRKIFPVKTAYRGRLALVATVNLGIGTISSLFNSFDIGELWFTASMILSIYLLFTVNLLQIFFLVILYLFMINSTRGILDFISVFLFGDIISNLLQLDAVWQILLWLSMLTSSLLCSLFGKKVVPVSRMKQLMNNREQLKKLLIHLLIWIVYLKFISTSYFMEMTTVWFYMLYGISCMISKFGLYMILRHAVRTSALFEYEQYTTELHEQLERQIQHYNAYQTFIEEFRTFRHDYASLMNSVKLLLNNQETEKAVQLINEIEETEKWTRRNYKSYSNHLILDAMLQEVAQLCEQNHIDFSALLPVPEHIGLKNVDIIRVFSNLFRNAFEACSKISSHSERFLKVRGHTSQDWVYVEVMNSFHGEVKLVQGKLYTTKSDEHNHGFGMGIVNEIIEGMGGVVLVEVDQPSRVFTVKLHIPRWMEDRIQDSEDYEAFSIGT